MTVSVINIRFDETTMWVELNDKRTIAVPLARFPRLLQASLEQLENYQLTPRGIHWETLDEDIAIAGLLEGQSDNLIS